MGTTVMSSNSSLVSEMSGNNTEKLLGLDEYPSDEALAAVELFKGYPDEMLQFASVCCVIFMIIGIPGNFITIVALARCKKVRNATALFIINLSLSDLLFCCFNLPLAASTFWKQSWTHGRVLCRLFPIARYALIAVSLLSVLAITINRYIIVSHPQLYPKLYTKRNLILMVAAIWIFSFCALIATWVEVWGRFSLNPSIGSCTIIEDIHGRSPKKILFITAFLLPGIAIVVCYARIFWIVRKVSKNSRSPIPIRPRAGTDDIVAETKSRDSILDKDTVTVNSNSKPRPHTFNCLSAASSEHSSNSGAESDYTVEDIDRTIKSSHRRSSSNEAARKIRIAFNNLRHSKQAPKALLPTKKDKKLRTMIVAIMLSFGLCHLPISLTKIFHEFSPIPVLKISSYLLLYLTTCINPVIYVVMSNEYRQAYKNLIMCRPQPSESDSTGMRIINGINKSFRRSEGKVKFKSTQEINKIDSS